MTQKEIAKTLNVSISTVSRALRSSPLISEETVQKVKKLARLAKYRPNQSARNLLTGKTYTAGIIFSFDDFFFRDLGHRISKDLIRHDYMGIFLTCKTEEEFFDATEKMLARGVDGIISTTVSAELSLKLKEEGLPVVFYGNETLPFDCVHVDKYKGGRLSAEYILKCGHKRIGYVGFNARDEREKAFLDVLHEQYIPLNETWIARGNASARNAAAATAQILSPPDRPTALVAHNDIAAIAAINTAAEMGFRVPADIAVIGFGNIDIAAYANPSLTTIDQKLDMISEQLVSRLMHRISSRDEHDFKKVVIEPELIIRRSC